MSTVSNKSYLVTQIYSDSNICMFGRWIQNQNWCEVNTASDVQSKAATFYCLVYGAITTIVPVKSVTSHTADKPWMTDDHRVTQRTGQNSAIR